MKLLGILVAAMALLSPLTAQAQDYPNHYITLIVPLAPGSGTDAIARLVAARLGDVLGKQIVVENKVGANGAIGTAAAARAAPDGYTLLVGGTTTHAGNPNLMKTITYNPVTDFTPVGQLGVYPYALLVSGSSPYATMADLVAAAKAKPGTLSFAYANALGQLSGEMLKQRASIDVTAVAYRGSPQAITDIIGGRVTMMFVDTTPATAQIQAGTVRALAVTTEHRTNVLPNVPTMAEAGLSGPRVEAWNGLFAPAKTPKPIIDKLSAALAQLLSQPDLKKQMEGIGFEAEPTTPEVFAKRVAEEVALWARLTKQAGLEPE
jgi:tripartite-type tricarboxylate transporter receptor subunit TctC